MDDPLKTFIDNLAKNQFADLKGSWANLHIQLPEKVLNEVVALAIKSQKDSIPWLGLVSATAIKGTVSVDVKLQVPGHADRTA